MNAFYNLVLMNQEPGYLFFVILIAVCLLMAIAGLYFLSRYKTLFRKHIKNEILRQNLVVWLIVFCLMIAMSPINYEAFYIIIKKGVLFALGIQLIISLANALIVFNLVRSIADNRQVKKTE